MFEDGYGHESDSVISHGKNEDGNGLCEVHVNTIEVPLVTAALLAAPAPRHLARQAAALSRFLHPDFFPAVHNARRRSKSLPGSLVG